MHRALPLHPSLEQLKKQAKDLRKGHQSASAEAAERIKESLPRLSDATVEEILQGHFSLQEAQHVIACEYGCKHWEMLCGVVDADLNVLAGLSDVHIQELLREVGQKDCTRAFNGAGPSGRAGTRSGWSSWRTGPRSGPVWTRAIISTTSARIRSRRPAASPAPSAMCVWAIGCGATREKWSIAFAARDGCGSGRRRSLGRARWIMALVCGSCATAATRDICR